MSNLQTIENQQPEHAYENSELSNDAWLENTLQQAVDLHQAGDLEAAERLYRNVLDVFPNQPNANHNLGVIKLLGQQADASLTYFRTALEADPEEQQYWTSYIEAMIQANQEEQAREILSYGIDAGLQGSEVEALIERLKRQELAAEPVTTVEQKSDITSATIIEKNLETEVLITTEKPAKPLPAKKSGTKPTKNEISSLTELFNQKRHIEAMQLALDMTRRFPKHGYAWKVLGALYELKQQLSEAISSLKIAIELMPKDAEVHYNLGNIYFDQEQLELAQNCYQHAVCIAPGFAQAHYNLGSVLKSLQQLDQAENCFKKALKINPENALMHFNLALMYFEQNRLPESIKGYQQALKFQPDFVSALVNLGITYKSLGKLKEAEDSYRKAIKINPDHASAYFNLGTLLKDTNRSLEAEECYRNSIRIKPDTATYNNLGILLRAKGQPREAEQSYRKAIALNSEVSAEIYSNLGVVLSEQNQFPEAEHWFRKALEISQNYPDASNNLGLALHSMGRLDEAEAVYENALEHYPDNVPLLSNFSIILNALGKIKKAEACLRKAMNIAPDKAYLHINLGIINAHQGQPLEAEANYLQALKIQPDHIMAKSNLLFTMNYSATHSIRHRLEQAQQYNQMVKAKVDHVFTSWNFEPHPKRLRIGLVSGDLHEHAVTYFLENLLKHLDLLKFELIAYPTFCRNDHVTARLKPYFSDWKPLSGLNDHDAAQLIHSDGIHILLDLSGHSAANRLPLFAWKPAPIQVSWLGYFATTGVEAIDYFIADEISIPEGNKSQFTEKIKYLPDSRLCFTQPEVAIDVSVLPALKNGYITFGCFQNMAKVNEETLNLWAEVMRATPNSKLRWQCKTFGNPELTVDVTQRFGILGIHPNRLILLDSVPRNNYLAAHSEVDLILDTFPFPGGTTTCEALWMGVPTLTLAGDTLIARQGASLLTAADLGDWVVSNKEEYVSKAISFCNNLEKLASLRAGLRSQVLASPLFDGQRFARNMEKALWEMWDEKQNDSEPVLKEKQHSETLNQAEINKVRDPVLEHQINTPVEIISATKLSESDFWSKSALGISLIRHMQQNAGISVNVAFNNNRGLSQIFNEQIEQAEEDSILVFVHDDVWIDEANFAETVTAGLEQFDVIGVAGNRRRLPNQPAWAFIDEQFTWDDKSNLSGQVSHGKSAFGTVSEYGKVPIECELLDGVFLACKKSALNQGQVRFDLQFDFHFYDMDFCRSARKAGLKLGTWLIRLTHQSGGAFGSQLWKEKYQLYLNKWEHPMSTISTSNQPLSLELQNAIQEVFQQATEQKNAGQIEQATNLYQEIIKIQKDHAGANHHLGVIETHTQCAQSALPWFEAAILAEPQNEQYWVSYIDALIMSGDANAAADAVELGLQHGLQAQTAQMLAKEFLAKFQSHQQAHPVIDPSSIHLYQIVYSKETLNSIEPEFQPLDNLRNERPDWREYWPIRNFLLHNTLKDDCYYGFFSPKFKVKTGLNAETIRKFISAHTKTTDVFLFSPFMDQYTFYPNIFQQGIASHQGIQAAFEGSIAKIAPEFDWTKSATDSRTSVFCNYFVAKPTFWRAWLQACELIFTEAENNRTTLAAELNSLTHHDQKYVPNKVFVIERIATLILSTQSHWNVKAYDSRLLPCTNKKIAKFPRHLVLMDALKIAYNVQCYPHFLSSYYETRQALIDEYSQCHDQPNTAAPAPLAAQKNISPRVPESFFQWFKSRFDGDKKPWLILGKGPSFSKLAEYDIGNFHTLSLNHAIRELPVDIAHIIDIDVINDCAEALLRNASTVVMPWFPHIHNQASQKNLVQLAEEHPVLSRLIEQGKLLWYNLSTANRSHAGEPIVQALYFSSEAALNLLAQAGVKTIRSLGIDGGNSYSSKFDDLKNKTLLSNGRTSFDEQFKEIAHTLFKTGINYAPLHVESPIRVFVGTTEAQMLGVKILEYSIKQHTSVSTIVTPMHTADVPIPIPMNPNKRPRTPFSFQRLIIPELMQWKGRAIYVDSDMQVFDDLLKVWNLPFNGAQLLAAREPGTSSRRPQFSVMLLDCEHLDWKISDIVQKMDNDRYTYEDIMYEMKIADCIRPDIDSRWNSLERFEPGVTGLLHYTDMTTQPWVSTANVLGGIWVQELFNAIDDEFVSRDEVVEHIRRQWVRPSLLWQVDARIADTVNLPQAVKDLDADFIAPYRSLLNNIKS